MQYHRVGYLYCFNHLLSQWGIGKIANNGKKNLHSHVEIMEIVMQTFNCLCQINSEIIIILQKGYSGRGWFSFHVWPEGGQVPYSLQIFALHLGYCGNNVFSRTAEGTDVVGVIMFHHAKLKKMNSNYNTHLFTNQNCTGMKMDNLRRVVDKFY